MSWLLDRRLEHEAPGVSGSILEGLDDAQGTVRIVQRNVKRWRHTEMALRWTAAGMLEAQKTFRRLKAYRQLLVPRKALEDHMRKAEANSAIEIIVTAG